VKLCEQFSIGPNKIYGHREVPGMYVLLGNGSRRYRKTCPGMGVDMKRVRSIISVILQVRMQKQKLYSGKIDGIWGRKSRKAFKKYTSWS
jgi:hypothetical protein